MKRTEPRAAQAIVNDLGERGWIELVRRYGTTFRHGSMIVTCDPEVVRTVLMDRPHVETRPAAYRGMAALPGLAGVLFMDGEPWLRRTKALAPVFHRRNIESYAGWLHAETVTRASLWHDSGSQPDLYEAIQQLGAAVVLEAGYGIEPSHPLGIALAQALVRYKNNSMSPETVLRFDRFHTGFGTLLAMPRIILRMRRDHAAVRKALAAVIAEGMTRDDRPNWLGRLVESGISGVDLANEVNHLYGAFNAADYITTAALYELARHPAIVQSIRAELLSALDGREWPERDDLARMPVTSGFLLEILRRYPVSMGVLRQTGAAMTVDGEEIPKGTQVMLLLHALHHHPDYWEEPDTIKPERWAASSVPKVAYSYVPFLLGARKCQGRDMAEQHLLLIALAIIRRFDIRVFAKATVPPFMVPRFGAAIPFTLDAADGR